MFWTVHDATGVKGNSFHLTGQVFFSPTLKVSQDSDYTLLFLPSRNFLREDNLT